MNRRSFLKTTAVTATTLPLVGCEFKPRAKSKWIAFTDQMPEATDKFEMKERRTGTIKEGKIIEFDTTDDGPNIELAGKEIHLVVKKQFIMYRLTENSFTVINDRKWDWRYV